MRAGLRAAILVSLLAAVLGGCGGADAPAVQPASPTPPPVAEAPPAPADPPPAEPPVAETQPPVETEPAGEGELELPAAVSEKREAIIAAAKSFDYAALEALLDPATFSYSFGEDGDPVGYWRELEEEGHVPVLGDILPVVLGTPFAKLDDIYVWPSAAAKEAPDWTEEDIESMRVLYTDEEIESMKETLGGYLGWRVGIREDDTWLYFVSGD